ncbi:hypothetical protein, partial [Serratia marcescens]|uniref:hypothetical protein n=1 Tax=Serratia marcescens TaxID=615 RepID=UPI003D322515
IYADPELARPPVYSDIKRMSERAKESALTAAESEKRAESARDAALDAKDVALREASKAVEAADAASLSKKESKENSEKAFHAAIEAEESADKAEAYAGIAQSGTDAYPDVAAAQAAIDAGIETRRYFSVRSTISTQWVDEYENVNGLATPTGRYLSNGKYVDEIAASVISLLASLMETNKRTAALRQYQSEQWQWTVESALGPSQTAMALDNDLQYF